MGICWPCRAHSHVCGVGRWLWFLRALLHQLNWGSSAFSVLPKPAGLSKNVLLMAMVEVQLQRYFSWLGLHHISTIPLAKIRHLSPGVRHYILLTVGETTEKLHGKDRYSKEGWDHWCTHSKNLPKEILNKLKSKTMHKNVHQYSDYNIEI